VLNRLIAALHEAYPFITPEVVYDPPDGVDAWVRLHGAADLEEWDEIRHFSRDVIGSALEDEGVLVLMVGGAYRDQQAPGVAAPTAAEREATIAKARRRARKKATHEGSE